MLVALPELDGAVQPMPSLPGATGRTRCNRLRSTRDARSEAGSHGHGALPRAHRQPCNAGCEQTCRTETLGSRKSAASGSYSSASRPMRVPHGNGGAISTSFESLLQHASRNGKTAGYDGGPHPPRSKTFATRVLERHRPTAIGTDANVHAAHVPADDHGRAKRAHGSGEIEAQWGPAPGKHQSDGRLQSSF